MNNQANLIDVIIEIENSQLQKLKGLSRDHPFELKASPWLLTNLSGSYGALFVRAILDKLNINEHHVFKWRLENKFMQYQIFNYYASGCMPESHSLSRLLKENNGLQRIKELISNGFFLKATLGDATFTTNSWDKTAELDHVLTLPDIVNGKYESYMLQKKLAIECEFRIHTFSKDIIPSLTYIIQRKIPVDNRDDAEAFLNGILQKLPDTIMHGTLIGWDIALDKDNHYYIIEANITGFHPEYRAGFQTTGLVDDHHNGAIICAWLNTYFHKKFGIYVDAIEDSLFLKYPFYRAFLYYTSIFKKEHIEFFENNRKKPQVSIMLYLGDETIMLVVYLIKHFLLVDFADLYYLIIRDEFFTKIKEIFKVNDNLIFFTEHNLFTKDQYLLIKQLGYNRRKFICYHNALKRITNKNCMLI